jgi:hypothetical protein
MPQKVSLRIGLPVNNSRLPGDLSILLAGYNIEFVNLKDYYGSNYANGTWAGALGEIFNSHIDTTFEQFYVTEVGCN